MRRRILPYNPRLKEIARRLRKEMTLAEVLLWQRLGRRQMCGYDFDRQRPIDEYIVDFFCKDLMLAVESDGRSHDFKGVKDIERQARLESLGVRFLRFTDKEVLANVQSVADQIEAWIREHADDDDTAPTPHPSKEGNRNRLGECVW